MRDDFYIRLTMETDDPGVLETLSRSDDAMVRIEVARNEDCPAEVLDALADDECKEVMGAVLSNPTASEEAVERIARFLYRNYHYSWVDFCLEHLVPFGTYEYARERLEKLGISNQEKIMMFYEKELA